MTNIPHLIEAALLLLVAYLIGCLVGFFLAAKVFKRGKPAEGAAQAKAEGQAEAVAQTPAKAEAAPAAAKTAAAKTAAAKPAAKKPAAKKAATAKKAPAKKAAASGTKRAPAKGKSTPAAPQKLDAPRNGKKDNLKTIKGIGPKIEGQLNDLGVYHFDQVAGWDRGTITWVDSHLSFKGRIDREKWVQQAKELAKSAK